MDLRKWSTNDLIQAKWETIGQQERVGERIRRLEEALDELEARKELDSAMAVREEIKLLEQHYEFLGSNVQAIVDELNA